MVFDIDDTLSESRARTLNVAKDWDQANGTNHFARLVVAQVGQSGADTARGLGLPEPVVADFQKHWDVEFWKGERFTNDTPIAPMVKLAKAAKAAGAEVIFLTGRIDALEGATIAPVRPRCCCRAASAATRPSTRTPPSSKTDRRSHARSVPVRFTTMTE